MPRTTLIAGGLLILLGLGFYLAPVVTGDAAAHWTALIPAIPGVLLVALGGLAAAMSAWRMHVMHAAMVVGVLVVLAGLGRGLPGLADPEAGAGVVASLLMALIGAVYVALGVRSFIAARRAREGEGKGGGGAPGA